VNNKSTYPMITKKCWSSIRNQFKQTIPSVVDVKYLKGFLNFTNDQSARNVLQPLKQMGLIDLQGIPTNRANDWRLDNNYANVCFDILQETYPEDFLALFLRENIDSSEMKSWFMNNYSLGRNAADKMTATFLLLKNTQDVISLNKNSSLESVNMQEKIVNNVAPLQIPASININIQVNISPDTTSEQIDEVFKSAAKYLRL